METKHIGVVSDSFTARSHVAGTGEMRSLVEALVKAGSKAGEFIPISIDPKKTERRTIIVKGKEQQADVNLFEARAKSIRGILSKTAQTVNAGISAKVVLGGKYNGEQVGTLGPKDNGVVAFGAVHLTPEQMKERYGTRKNKKSTATA